MKFLIKEISTSRKELRITLNPIDVNGVFSFVFGSTNSTFGEGTIDQKYIPLNLSKYISPGPQPAIIRLIVAYLKDTIGTPSGFESTILTLKDNVSIPIINIVVDDIEFNKFNIRYILSSMVVKLIKSITNNS